MHHLSSPEQTRAYLRVIIERIRTKAAMPMTLPWLMTLLAKPRRSGCMGPTPESIILLMTAIAQFTDLNEQTEAITIQSVYGRHDDETLARMVWQALLRGACGQHPAHS